MSALHAGSGLYWSTHLRKPLTIVTKCGTGVIRLCAAHRWGHNHKMDQLGYELPKLSADFASHLHGQVPWYLRNKAKGSGKTKVKPRSQSQPNQKQRLLREPSFYFGNDRKSSSGRKSTSAERRSMSEKYLQIGVPMTHLKRPATTSHYSRIESSLSNPVNAIKFHDCQNNHSMTNLRDIRDSVSSHFKPRVSISTPLFWPPFQRNLSQKNFLTFGQNFFFCPLQKVNYKNVPFACAFSWSLFNLIDLASG